MVRSLRVSLISALPFGFARTRYVGLMHPSFLLPAFQSIIDNMTLSEAEITEYGGPF